MYVSLYVLPFCCLLYFLFLYHITVNKDEYNNNNAVHSLADPRGQYGHSPHPVCQWLMPPPSRQRILHG